MNKKNVHVICSGMLLFSVFVQASQPCVKDIPLEPIVETIESHLAIMQPELEVIQNSDEALQTDIVELPSVVQLNNQPMPPCYLDPHDANINWWNDENYAQYAVTTAVVLPLIGWLSNNSFSSFYASNNAGLYSSAIPKP
jgi:hypothetical protein